MKPIKPVDTQPEQGYPTAGEAGVTRRGWLKVLLASGAAVAGGGIVLGGLQWRTPGKPVQPSYEVVIDLEPPLVYPGCRSAIVGIVARVYHREFRAFLEKPSERPGIIAAIRDGLRKHRCAALGPPRSEAMGESVAAALEGYHKRRTGSDPGEPSVTLVVRPR